MNETVGSRQANLARLLRLAHLEGPLSRATLTAATGLNRSTIADLVGDLVSLGVVEERAPDPSRRVGRPSPLVSAHPRVMAIAVNPEVDALTMSAVGLDRTVRRRERIEMADLIGPERTAQLIAERIDAWRPKIWPTPRSPESASRCPVSCARRTGSCAMPRTCGGPTSRCAS